MSEKERAELERLSQEVQGILGDRTFLYVISDVPVGDGAESSRGIRCVVSVHGRHDMIRYLLARTLMQLDMDAAEVVMDMMACEVEDVMTGGPGYVGEVPIPKKGDVKPHVRVLKNGKVVTVSGYSIKKWK
jgi:hypothetical protein